MEKLFFLTDRGRDIKMDELTAKLRFYHICILMKNAPEGELFDKVVRESEKAIMMNEVNLKPCPRGAFTSKKSYNMTN